MTLADVPSLSFLSPLGAVLSEVRIWRSTRRTRMSMWTPTLRSRVSTICIHYADPMRNSRFVRTTHTVLFDLVAFFGFQANALRNNNCTRDPDRASPLYRRQSIITYEIFQAIHVHRSCDSTGPIQLSGCRRFESERSSGRRSNYYARSSTSTIGFRSFVRSVVRSLIPSFTSVVGGFLNSHLARRRSPLSSASFAVLPASPPPRRLRGPTRPRSNFDSRHRHCATSTATSTRRLSSSSSTPIYIYIYIYVGTSEIRTSDSMTVFRLAESQRRRRRVHRPSDLCTLF